MSYYQVLRMHIYLVLITTAAVYLRMCADTFFYLVCDGCMRGMIVYYEANPFLRGWELRGGEAKNCSSTPEPCCPAIACGCL